jgi:hypothetical protein
LAVPTLAIPLQKCGFGVQHTVSAVIEALRINTTRDNKEKTKKSKAWMNNIMSQVHSDEKK